MPSHHGSQTLDPDVGDGFERALSALAGERVEPPPPSARLDVLFEFSTSSSPRCSPTIAASTIGADAYRPAIRARLEHAEKRAMTAEEYVTAQIRRAEDTAAWCDWLAEHRIDAIVEPTVPIVAPPRGAGYDEVFGDVDDLSLTPLLGLDRVPRRLAPVRHRKPQRSAGGRVADRCSGH
jgi:Asp-tRNA(Asn)/Glu-tRNA(Gln) amidotransferase A subunit family amidase